MKKKICLLAAITLSTAQIFSQNRQGGDPHLSEVWQPEPRTVSPGKTSLDAPSDAIVLFNGKGLSEWESATGGEAKWKLQDDYVEVVKGSGIIRTKKAFGDCQLHIEWSSNPTPDTTRGDGQSRGNSGIFLMGLYELQVLDNFHKRTYSNGQAGSIYKQSMPLVNVCRPPGEWQTYDIIFTAPRFNSDSSLRSSARITVFQNGVLVQNNFSIWGGTEYIGIPVYKVTPDKLPIALQDHGNPVRYRNIWIREL